MVERLLPGRRARWLLLTLLLLLAITGCTSTPVQEAPPVDQPAAPGGNATPPTAPAEPPRLLPGGIPEIVARLQPSVVAVETGQGEGSGVVYRADGLIVTNEHVVRGAREVEVRFQDGRRSPARVVAADQLTDLALLKAERTGLKPATFAQTLPRVGELAVAIGNPLGFENSATAGIISGLHRNIPGSATGAQPLVDLIQTDAAISPGNSGGALVGADARVLGINEAYIPPEQGAVSLGFAIPAPTVVDVVTQLIQTGEVRHAFMGVTPQTVTEQLAEAYDLPVERGAIVVEVQRGSPADRAGLAPGDIIVAMGGQPVETTEDLLARIRQHEPGDQVRVEYFRGRERRTTTVTLGERTA